MNGSDRFYEAPWSWWPTWMASIMSSYARAFAPEWLHQPILPGWNIGNTYIVSDENSRDPGTERRIVAEASYGRQLGRIMEALVVLVNQQPEAARKADGPLKDLLELSEEIARIKEDALLRRVGRLRADLRLLKKTYPEQYKQLMDALR